MIYLLSIISQKGYIRNYVMNVWGEIFKETQSQIINRKTLKILIKEKFSEVFWSGIIQ